MDQVVKFMEPLGVMVLVRGPDPKLAKANASSFYTATTGLTTLSASGNVHDRLFTIIICDCAALLFRSIGACILSLHAAHQQLNDHRITDHRVHAPMHHA